MNNVIEPQDRIYTCIDLKSFYASVECVERGLDPFKTNLVVADPSRGRGAICLAVSPALKALGVRNRCRIFEIPAHIKYITAVPRMQLYMDYSAGIFNSYLEYLSAQDIHVYSIDECFIYLSPYLLLYKMTPKALVQLLVQNIIDKYGICATAGIGSNMFLAKVALDILAKHQPDHMAFLDEALFKEKMWHHRPLTDFWNIGKGTARRLARKGIYDLYGVAHCEQAKLYKEFGINAEYLIDHAWGRESCTLVDLQHYQPKNHSIANSQILFEDYAAADALIVMLEMVEFLCLKLVETQMLCSSFSLSIRYSKDCLPPTGGSRRLPQATDSFAVLEQFFQELFWQTTAPHAPIRQVCVSANDLVWLGRVEQNLFSAYAVDELRDRDIQQALLDVKEKYGKNAILRGLSYRQKATGRLRNKLIGGHNSGC
ncbi:MAG: DNA repair protein [Phascolarctobacterium sp.]